MLPMLPYHHSEAGYKQNPRLYGHAQKKIPCLVVPYVAQENLTSPVVTECKCFRDLGGRSTQALTGVLTLLFAL